MAHYAFLDNQNIVTAVIVGKDETEGIDYETLYGNIKGQKCKRTSYNTFKGVHTSGREPFRGNYAGIGFKYMEEIDAFMPPAPFESWIVDTDSYEWIAPVPHPNPEYANTFYWDEDVKKWQLQPSPYPSWQLNSDTYEWEPPIAMPDDGMIYRWDEDSISWEFVANPADLVDQ